nr:hypothetical protein [Massilia sp. Gc5]
MPREAVDLGQVAVGFGPGDARRQLDGQLFVGDRRLQRRMVGRQQATHQRRLMLFDPPHLGQRLAQRHVAACRPVREAHGLAFDAGHEDHAHAGEGIVVQLADRLAHHVAPRGVLPVERRALGIEDGKCHGRPPVSVR